MNGNCCKASFPALVLLLVAVPSFAQEYEDVMARACERDPAVAAADRALDAARAEYANLSNPFSFEAALRTGNARVSFPPAGTVFKASPGISLSLNSGTTLDAGCDLSLSTGGSLYLPSVGFSQTLDRLLGLEGGDPELLAARAKLASAELNSAAARSRARSNACLAAEAVIDAELALLKAEDANDDAKRDLEDAKALGTYSPGSAGMLALESGSAAAGTALAYARRAYELRLAYFERIAGSRDLPAPPAGARLDAALAAADPERFPTVLAKARNLEAVERAVEEDLGGYRLSLSLDGSLERSGTTAALADKSDWYLGTGFSYGTLEGSVGGGWNEADSGYPYVAFSLTWSPEAYDSPKSATALSTLEAAKSALDQARLDASETLSGWILEALKLEGDAYSIAARLESLEASLFEAQRKRSSGMIDDRGLAKAKRALRDVEYESSALAWELLSLYENAAYMLGLPGPAGE